MTNHTDAEFEIQRKAAHLFEDASNKWMERAIKAEDKLQEIDKAINEYRYSEVWDQALQEIIDR